MKKKEDFFSPVVLFLFSRLISTSTFFLRFYPLFTMHLGIIIVRNSIYDSQNLYAGACCDTGIMFNFFNNYSSGKRNFKR